MTGGFHKKLQWTGINAKDVPKVINDAITINISKSTEIKNNLLTINLKNPAAEFGAGTTVIGEYINPTDLTISFNEDDEFKIWAEFTDDATKFATDTWNDEDNLLGNFIVEEFQLETSENSSRITMRCIDTAFLLFNKVHTFSYGISNTFTTPGIIRQLCRKFGEKNPNSITSTYGTQNDEGTLYVINSKFVSEGGYIKDYRDEESAPSTTLSSSIISTAVTIPVDSTTGFQSSGTIVVGTEHIAYTGITATTFTGCTRKIDDTLAQSHSSGVTVYQGFPKIILGKIWKPIFEWVGEVSQSQNTNYLNELQEGGTIFYNRAFLFWIDQNNEPHFFYPDDEVDLSFELGEEGRRAFRLEKSVFDAINFIVYNVGEDMYGNGALHYFYDKNSEVSSLKMRYQPMIKIIPTLVNEDINQDSKRVPTTSRETTNQDALKNFVVDGDYPFVPSFLSLANDFRQKELGLTARTDVANDTEYNDALREAAKQQGLVEAQKITTKRSGLRYKGQLVTKGVRLNPGDLVRVTNGFNGMVNQLLRVLRVTHNISPNGWETTLQVEEDETTA